MKRKYLKLKHESLDLDMTPIIDMVFLLMIFFVFTFKTFDLEGDFTVNMPVTGVGAASATLDETEPVRIRLVANSEGELDTIIMGDRSLGTSFAALRQQVMVYVASLSQEARKNQEAELNCDYNLKYKYTIDAMTAISGYFDQGQIIPLIEKVKFAPTAER